MSFHAAIIDTSLQSEAVKRFGNWVSVKTKTVIVPSKELFVNIFYCSYIFCFVPITSFEI